MPNKMPNKPCKSCADKIIKMRELKRLRKLEQQLLESDSLKRIALDIKNWTNNISHSTIKDIIKK